MKKFQNYFLSCFLVLISCSLLAQQYKIDSLITVLKTSKQDTSRINTLLQLSRHYSNTGSNEPARQYAQQALQESEKLNYKKGLAGAYNNIGVVYWNKGDFEMAKDFFSKALNTYEEIGNKTGIANAINNIGLIYWTQGNFEIALNHLLRSLKIWEEIGDKGGIGMSYLNLGNIYMNQSNYDKALEFYSKSLLINKETGNKALEATNYNNIGIIYEYKGNLEKTLENQLKALKIREEINDKKGVAMSYNNIGLVYYEQGKYKNALESQMKAQKINMAIGNKQGLAVSYSNIGNIYFKEKKYDDAVHYNILSLNLCKSIGFKLGVRDAFIALYDLYEETGDYKQAYNYHKLYTEIKDTLYNEQSSKQMTEMNTKYDSEKKDKELIKKDIEITKQQAETEKKNLQRNAFIVGFALVLILAFFIFRGYRQKKYANKLLEGKNLLIENQKLLVEEKTIKITDSINYAKRIQQAILPTNEVIKSVLPESFVFFQPKDIVSGDFYWMHTINDHEVLLAAADCTGHGVPGALMSMMGYNLLEQVVKEHLIDQPAKVLDELSKLIIESLKQTNSLGSNKEGMDIALCKINFKNYELQYAGAHNSLYLIRNAELLETKADRRSLGITMSNASPFSNHKVKLEKGDCLYVFSDGYVDQFGGSKNEKFYYQPFQELLKKIHLQPMEEQRKVLEKVMSEWKGSREQIDDLLVIGIRI